MRDAPIIIGSADRPRHVLVVLDGEPAARSAALNAGIRLAVDAEARMTLAAVADYGRILRWLGRSVHPELLFTDTVDIDDLRSLAGYQLAHAGEFVPDSVPLSTLGLGPRPAAAVRDLMQGREYDAFVGPARLLAQDRRLLSGLRRPRSRRQFGST